MPKTEVTGSQIKDQSVSLSVDVTGVLPVANGGSGSNTIALNNVVLGNGSGAVQTVAPGASGNVLTSNGTTWVSENVPYPVSSVAGKTGAVTLTASDVGLSNAETQNNKAVANGYASLDSNGKVPGSQLPNSIMTYEGLHNPSTNSPTLSDASGNAGQVYRISIAGSRNYGSGTISLEIGDYLIHNGSVWEKADTTDAVSSVNGQTGALTGFVTETGAQIVSQKTFTAPVVDAPSGVDPLVVKVNGSTAWTVNQYGELFGNAGTGVYYDSNVSTTAVSSTGALWLTSGKGGSAAQDITIDPSGAGKVKISSDVEVTGAINLGHASDTTLTRSAAGVVAVEGVPLVTTTSVQSLSNKTISGTSNTLSNISVTALSATGTADSTTYLRGDGVWAAAAGLSRSISSFASDATLASAANTDYVAFVSNNNNISGHSILVCDGVLNAAIVDSGISPVTWTSTGGTTRIDPNIKKWGTASLSCDGVNFLYSASSTNFRNNLPEFTVEGWVRPGSVSAGVSRTFFSTLSANNASGLFAIGHNNTTLEARFSGLSVQTAANCFALNTWTHVALVGEATTCKVYINGVLKISVTRGTSGQWIDSSARTVTLGSRNGQELFSGRIDQFVFAQHAAYKDNFTPPGDPGTTGTTITLPSPVANINRYTVVNTGSLPVNISGNVMNTNNYKTVPLASSREYISDGATWYSI